MYKIKYENEIYEIEHENIFEGIKELFYELGMDVYEIYASSDNIYKLVVTEDDMDELAIKYIKVIW